MSSHTNEKGREAEILRFKDGGYFAVWTDQKDRHNIGATERYLHLREDGLGRYMHIISESGREEVMELKKSEGELPPGTRVRVFECEIVPWSWQICGLGECGNCPEYCKRSGYIICQAHSWVPDSQPPKTAAPAFKILRIA